MNETPPALERALDWRRGARLVGPARSPRAPSVIDALLAAGCLAIAAVDASLIGDYGPHPALLASTALAVVIGCAQWARKTAPIASLAVTILGLLAYAVVIARSSLWLGFSPILLTALPSLHAAIRWIPDRRYGAAALAWAVVGAVLAPIDLLVVSPASPLRRGMLLTGSPQAQALNLWSVSGGLALLGVLAVLLVAIDASRRRSRALAVEERLDREKDEASAAERLRIARELHDLLGHGLTSIAVQASTVLAVGTDAHRDDALSSIASTARTSLAEVRDLVRALRDADSPTAPTADPRALLAAVDNARRAGLVLDAALPDPDELDSVVATWPATTRLALVRALQEGLTNAIRHGDGTACVRLTCAPDGARLLLTNPLPARTGRRGSRGTGLIGLAERIALAGGTLDASPDPGGRVFTLDLRLPAARRHEEPRP
ncbi:histidine kinase [Actinomyces sp. B33]|uniref:sensor histidine kinase n=1 Tax=Actinomyces sp. B33 TaxID=2942131 RepID=UPI0023408C84|nr:histidine kinase [Actinomyces sp. B33]MDC4232402.1 histidine kinase [Actinomyces sp. B33]